MSHLDKFYSLLKENNDYSVKDDFIKVLVIEPKKAPYVKEVRDTLDTWQDLVDGWIEVTYPFDDGVVVVGNEEAKLRGMEGNRHINGAIYAGPIVLVGDTGYGDFRGLTDKEIAKYTDMFKTPENISDDEVQDDMGFMVFGFESKKPSGDKKTVTESNEESLKKSFKGKKGVKESFDIDPVKGTWLNCELSQEESKALKQYLRDNGIKFETSGVGDNVHFEILYKNQDQVDGTDRFLSNVVDGWEVIEACGKKGKKEEKKEVKESENFADYAWSVSDDYDLNEEDWKKFVFGKMEEQYGPYRYRWGKTIPREIIEKYFDYGTLGEDIIYYVQDAPEYHHLYDYNGNEYECDSAGEYWCNDKDATPEEIGRQYVKEMGFDDMVDWELEFDYDSYGKDYFPEEYAKYHTLGESKKTVKEATSVLYEDTALAKDIARFLNRGSEAYAILTGMRTDIFDYTSEDWVEKLLRSGYADFMISELKKMSSAFNETIQTQSNALFDRINSYKR